MNAHAPRFRFASWQRKARERGRVALVVAVMVGCEPAEPGAADAGEAFPNRRLQLPLDRTLGFVANQDSDTVTVVDFGSGGAAGAGGMGGSGAQDVFELLAELPIGRDPVDFDGPRALLFDRQRDVFYVALSYSQSATSAHVVSARRAGYLQVLARDDLRPLSDVRLRPAAFALALSLDGSELVASHYDTELPALAESDPLEGRAVLAFVDPDAPERPPSEVPVCIAPADIAYAGPGVLLLACVGDDAVVRMDDREITSQLDLDPAAPQKPAWLIVDDPAERVAVSYEVTRQVGILRTTGPLTLEHLIDVEGVPQRALWLSTTRLLVPTVGPDALVVLDLETDSKEREILFEPSDCRVPAALTQAASGRLFLVCRSNHFEPGTLLELHETDLQVIGRVELGLLPDRLVLDER